MKFRIDEFRISDARPAEAPLDFTLLCEQLAALQAETPTARLARHNGAPTEHHDHDHRAAAILLAAPRTDAVGGLGVQGSFHAGAAARVGGGAR